MIHCASLHKILAPGMRLGWIAAGRWQPRVEMLKYTQTRNNEVLSQIGAGEFMGTGAYDRHLRRLRTALLGQRERTAEAIARYFPAGTKLNLPNGGLQLWVEMPKECSSAAVFDAALREGILVAPGWLFSNGGRSDHFLRLNCGWPYDDVIDGGLRRLGEIVGESECEFGAGSYRAFRSMLSLSRSMLSSPTRTRPLRGWSMPTMIVKTMAISNAKSAVDPWRRQPVRPYP